MRRRAGSAAILVLLAVGAALAGCGQKGPLYLPGESAETVEPGLSDEAGSGPEEREEEDEDAGEQP